MSSPQSQVEFNQGLLQFLTESPTPFHATQSIARRLRSAGFVQLQESEAWNIAVGGRYFVTRNDSSIIAFIYGSDPLTDTGIRMLGAHTDSPCLKLKPRPELNRRGYYQLGVEVYGGALLAPWYDRDLSLAGRVSYRAADDSIASILIDFKQPIAVVPSLAIHLDREANNSRSINAQKDIVPVLLQLEAEDTPAPDFRQILLKHIQKQHPGLVIAEVLDYELSFYDTQPPALVGLEQEFIASARLDNLLSCYTGLASLLHAGSNV
jgi:aspartyl aminopeptidase